MKIRSLLLLIILFSFGCSNVTESEKQKLISELDKELFDLKFDYNGYKKDLTLKGRLKNTLNCKINSLTFEVYLHEAVKDTTIPDPEDGELISIEDLLNRYKPGKVLDQETIGFIKYIEPGVTKSFMVEKQSSMRVDQYYPPQVKLVDFSSSGSYSTCLETY